VSGGDQVPNKALLPTFGADVVFRVFMAFSPPLRSAEFDRYTPLPGHASGSPFRSVGSERKPRPIRRSPFVRLPRSCEGVAGRRPH
jgi:hypothetical protein